MSGTDSAMREVGGVDRLRQGETDFFGSHCFEIVYVKNPRCKTGPWGTHVPRRDKTTGDGHA